jgi:uncharacterized membrane protein
MQNRLKSPVFWGALVAQILSVLVLLGVITPAQNETVTAVVASVLQAAVSFGLLNDPTNPNGF